MERLPNELLNNIAAEIDCPKDLLALATTSKAWCETRTLCGRRRLVWIFFAEHPGLAYHAHTLELGNGSTGTARVPAALLAARGINYDSTKLHQALSNNLKKAMS
ncbi:hypothetical protein M422DRAFT_253381 [Sphaerobolus stellatus SS14]|uniref:F-box domain-containing protein n=1 Tax=Sphaerobolus stellatus (strain SS14) TaxID=990650 RepID=A0A0C9V845_SPHS4|nr:hypothetical protein M422DRAFT_253381 [Sphaerobolus stellatus SS14]